MFLIVFVCLVGRHNGVEKGETDNFVGRDDRTSTDGAVHGHFIKQRHAGIKYSTITGEVHQCLG